MFSFSAPSKPPPSSPFTKSVTIPDLLRCVDTSTQFIVTYDAPSSTLKIKDSAHKWNTDNQVTSTSPFKASGGNVALGSKSLVFIRTHNGQECSISCSKIVWLDWYPFNLDCLLTIDAHGRICTHTISESDTISTRNFVSLRIPAFVKIVDAVFGMRDSLTSSDLLSNLSLFVLCDNGDLVTVVPVLIAPLKLPIPLLADLSSDEQQKQLEASPATPLEHSFSKLSLKRGTLFESLLRSSTVENQQAVIRVLPRPWSAMHPAMQGPFPITPEPKNIGKPSRASRVVVIDGQDALFIAISYCDNRIDILALLDPLQIAWNNTEKQLETLYLVDTLLFDKSIADITSSENCLFIRDASGRVWQADISGEADVRCKLLKSTSEYMLRTIEDRTGDTFLHFSPDAKLNISAESATLPIEIRQEVAPAVETIWPPFDYKSPAKLSISIPESFGHGSTLFPEGLDEVSLEAVNQLMLQWRTMTLEPLLHTSTLINQRSRRLLDFIIRLQTMQDRLDAKLLGHKIKGVYNEGIIEKRYAEMEDAVREVEGKARVYERRVQGLERLEGTMEKIETNIKALGKQLKGMKAKVETRL